MVKNQILRQYCRKVSRKLPLPVRERKTLLAGVQDELSACASTCTSLKELTAQIGTPAETAQELLTCVASERVQAYQKRRHWCCILAAILIVLAGFSISLAYCQKMAEMSIKYAEAHIVVYPPRYASEIDVYSGR